MADRLVERLARLEARAEIQELVMRYFLACDDRDYATVAALFTDDATFGDSSGREAVVERLRSQQAAFGATIHSGHGTVIDFEGTDAASGVVLAHCEIATAGTTTVGAMRYYDSYSRRDGRWLFSARRIAFYYLCPWHEGGSSLTALNRKRVPGFAAAPADLPAFERRAD